jgi:hypothetical protein
VCGFPGGAAPQTKKAVSTFVAVVETDRPIHCRGQQVSMVFMTQGILKGVGDSYARNADKSTSAARSQGREHTRLQPADISGKMELRTRSRSRNVDRCRDVVIFRRPATAFCSSHECQNALARNRDRACERSRRGPRATGQAAISSAHQPRTRCKYRMKHFTQRSVDASRPKSSRPPMAFFGIPGTAP